MCITVLKYFAVAVANHKKSDLCLFCSRGHVHLSVCRKILFNNSSELMNDSTKVSEYSQNELGNVDSCLVKFYA